MRTLVHLSDLHFGRADRDIVDALRAHVTQRKPDMIAVSGDLTQRARRWQFREARTFLDSLPNPKLVIPGNHDVPLYNIAARFLRPLGGFARHITHNLSPIWKDNELMVFGANTTRSFTVKGGRFRPRDVARIVEAMKGASDERVKVVVAHHPFGTAKAAADAACPPQVPDAVETLIRAGADVFLTGHLHVTYAGHTAARYTGCSRSAIVVEAGTATSTRVRGEGNAFNVLRIEPSRIVVEHLTWDASRRVFAVSDARAFVRGSDGWAPTPLGTSAEVR